MTEVGMSSHADTPLVERVRERAERITNSHSHSNVARALARDSLALVAENQRLRDALERVRKNAQSWHGSDPDGIDYAHHGQQKALHVIAEWCNAALDGTPSAVE